MIGLKRETVELVDHENHWTKNFELELSKFKTLKTFNKWYVQGWNIDSIVGFLYPASYASRRFFGDQIEEFEMELRTNLLKLNKTGKFTETAVSEALIGKKGIVNFMILARPVESL